MGDNGRKQGFDAHRFRAHHPGRSCGEIPLFIDNKELRLNRKSAEIGD